MRGGDHARLGVGEEHRPAIRRADADGDARPIGHDGVGLRAVTRPPNVLDDHRVGAVHLIGRREPLERRAEMARGARAVLQHRLARILRADAGIEPAIDAGRDAAFAREEGVRDAGKRKRRRFDRREAGRAPCMSGELRCGRFRSQMAKLIGVSCRRKGGGATARPRQRQHLEERAHLIRPGEPLDGGARALRASPRRRSRRAGRRAPAGRATAGNRAACIGP